jgi:superfamily II DNA or RNA helicase
MIDTIIAPAVQLRPYQEDALTAIEDARHAGKHTALVVQPTGTGKTVTFAALIQRLDVPTLILAHREELLTQAREKLLTLWPGADIGIIGAGLDERNHRITIASVQSATRPKRLDCLVALGVRLVVVDEAHHILARSYRAILSHLSAGEAGGPFLLGVTATPDRGDRQDITILLGKPVYQVTLPEMICAGYLCDLKGLQVRTAISLDGVGTRSGDFNEEQLAAAVNRADRNQVIVAAYGKHAAGRPAIAFAAGVEHAHDLADAFRSAGITAAALDGETPREERRQMLADYAAGRLQVVCNCGVLTEGFDAPATAAVILARPTQSRSLYVQMVGRGARPAPGKQDCLVIDVADATIRHSLVQSLPQLVGRAGYTISARVDGTDDGDGAQSFSVRDALEAPTTGRIVERATDLLQSFPWRRIGGGDYALRVGRATFYLTLNDQGYRAHIRWNDGATQPLTVSPVTLDWAQSLAERAAAQIQQGQAYLVDRRASWRYTPASDKQLWRLRKLGVKVSGTLTKGEASDLIDAAVMRSQPAS